MRLIYLYSLCLILGIFLSQLIDLGPSRLYINLLADIALAYIMMEVGLEFLIDKGRWKRYLWDFVVAATAATFPWLLCFLYFYFVFHDGWKESLMTARFSAPTATGILFSMLAAAGLSASWLFKKIRILAVLDDIYTLLILVPLQLVFPGSSYVLSIVIVVIVALVVLTWTCLHRIKLPSSRLWLFMYGTILVFFLRSIHLSFGVEISIILPAFTLGAILYNPHDPRRLRRFAHEHNFLEPQQKSLHHMDRTLKTLFMLCVGLLLPRIDFDNLNIWFLALHVIAITLLSNLGKCFPMLCYRNDASLKERVGLGIGMFPRGEVGAGVLMISISQGASLVSTTVAGLSLALNLLLTGFFIMIVVRLIHRRSIR